MKREIYYCDSCNKDIINPTKVCFRLESFTDAAGGSDHEQKCFDYCPECAEVLLNSVIDKYTTLDFRKITVKRLRKNA